MNGKIYRLRTDEDINPITDDLDEWKLVVPRENRAETSSGTPRNRKIILTTSTNLLLARNVQNNREIYTEMRNMPKM